MTTDIHLLSGAYAVDALDDDERAEFEKHLMGCVSCRDEVRGLREAAAQLTVLTQSAPPARLRAAILAEAATVRPLPPEGRVVPFRRFRRAYAAGAGLVAAAVLAVMLIVNPFGAGSPFSTDDVSQVMAADDAQKHVQDLDDGGRITWYTSEELDRVAVVADDLDDAPAGHVYELWLADEKGSMSPAGFLSGKDGHRGVLDGSLTSAAGAGISVEPDGGSPQPTTDPVTLVEFDG